MNCRCGCGVETNKGRFYIHGHNERGASHRRFPLETRVCQNCYVNFAAREHGSRKFCSRSCSSVYNGKNVKRKMSILGKINKVDLEKCYSNEELTLDDMAKILGTSRGSISKCLIVYNIPKRRKHMSKEYCLKKSFSMKGKAGNAKGKHWSLDEQTKSRYRRIAKEVGSRPGIKKMRSDNAKEIGSRPEIRKVRSDNSKKNWENPEYVKKVRARKTPSGLENNFIDLIAKNNWNLVYVGNFELNIGRRFPDFWNGDKKLVELFGYYHKDKNEVQERMEHYKKLGYDCLILWASDLNKNKIEKTIDMVSSFLR